MDYVYLFNSVTLFNWTIFPWSAQTLGRNLKTKGDGGGGDNCNYKTCKAPVKSSPPTNQHPTFPPRLRNDLYCVEWDVKLLLMYICICIPYLTGRMPSLSTNQRCQCIHYNINIGERPYICKQNIAGYSTWVRWVVSTNIMQFNEFEYHFTCRRKDVHLCFITSPGKMIFAVLELWLSPLQWVLNL